MSKSNNNNNNSNGIFINQISESQPELQQPSIKRQRIDASSDSTPPKSLPAFLDDSGNSTSSTPSSPSPVNENEIVNLKSCEELSDKECLIQFQNHLTQHQCLCGLSERTIKVPYRLYTVTKPTARTKSSSSPEEVHHYVKPLKHWPDEFLLKYLSNLQLLFNVYLKQNAKGNICGKIMELCDFLIRNEVKIFEDLIELCNSIDNSNNFISYESSKIITYFLIIIKDEIDQEWLKKIVDNLFTFEHLDYVAVKRINFSLDIIKCIVEWKDHDEQHRSEEDEAANFQAPSLETNYFATTFHDQNNAPSTSNALPLYLTSQTSNNSGRSSATSGHHSPPMIESNGCHLVQMTDSESFDTTHIKCITTKILANKWPALVKNISSLITQLSNLNSRRASSENLNNAENCILTFISLWERIISVKTNLSVIETLPFTAHLANFELRLNQNLPCTIYKQMLQLFNEALCYGSTLALQDLLPEETCNLAHQIIRHVKDNRILESMPRQVTANETDDNLKTFIGLNCETVAYLPHSLDQTIIPENSVNSHSSMTFDKSLLQKMTLVVLKSVAVSVKEIRIDSSDSSIDSTDYEAFQEMTLIENSIRDVLKKLESFIKNTLEFHPESHFSKILIHLFDDQDDFLIEAMVCTLDVTSGISYRNNAFPELVAMLNPVYTFLEFLKMISNSADLLLDLLVSSETCFLLYLLRFLKYIRFNWSMFVQSCRDCGMGHNVLDDTMDVLTRLRHKIGRLVSKSLYPYDIAPILRLLESCENLYEGNELS